MRKLALKACISIYALTTNWVVAGVAGTSALGSELGSEDVKIPQEHLRPVQGLIPDNYAAEERAKVSVNIMFISPLKRGAQSGSPEVDALLTLSITNGEKETIQIPFSKLASGKGAHLANSSETAPKFSILKEDSNLGCYAADTALLRYQWFDSTEKCTLIGRAILTNDEVNIAPGESQMLHVPVKLPVEQGRYRFALQFDNTMIPMLHSGANNRLIQGLYGIGSKQKFIRRELSAYFFVTERPEFERASK